MTYPEPLNDYVSAENIVQEFNTLQLSSGELDIAVSAIQKKRAQFLVDLAFNELAERPEVIGLLVIAERQHFHDFGDTRGESKQFVTNIWSQLGKRYAAHHARARLFWYKDFEHLEFPVRCAHFNERMASFDQYTKIIGRLDVHSIRDYVDTIEQEIEKYGVEATEKIMGPGLGIAELKFLRDFSDAKIAEAEQVLVS